MTFNCRAPEPEDLDYIYTLENNNEHWNASDIHQPISKEVLRQWLFAGVDVYESKHLRLMICLDKKQIGCLDLTEIDFFHQHAQVAVLIEDAHRGKGGARFALSYLIDFAENSLGLKNLFAEVAENNLHSIKLFEMAAFEQVGLRKKARKQGDKFLDIKIYQRSL